jgi:ketosteroid isomerase-like protein
MAAQNLVATIRSTNEIRIPKFPHPDASFEAEEIIVRDKRAVVRWVYRKMRDGQPWHLQGVDIFEVRDGRVAAKLAYVKG